MFLDWWDRQKVAGRGMQCCVAHWDLLTIWSITPAVTPPAILKAAGKLSRPAPRAAFTTMKTAPKGDTPLSLLLSDSRSWLDSTLGLCSNQALSPELIVVPAPPHSSTSVLIAMGQQTGGYTRAPEEDRTLSPGRRLNREVCDLYLECSATVGRQLIFLGVNSASVWWLSHQ